MWVWPCPNKLLCHHHCQSQDAVRRLTPLRGELEQCEQAKKECVDERDEAIAVSTEEIRSLGEEEKAVRSLSQGILK